MVSNITIIGPRAIGKSTVCRLLSKQYNLEYIEFDNVLDNYLTEYGGLIKSLRSRVVQKILNKEMPCLIDKILSNESIILELGGGSICSMNKKTNQKDFAIILDKSIVIPLLYSSCVSESIGVLCERELKRVYPNKRLSKTMEDYQRFVRVINKKDIKPVYCAKKSIEEICVEINKKISGTIHMH